MLNLLRIVLRTLWSGIQSRHDLTLENLALRHQLSLLQRTTPKPRLEAADRCLRVLFQGWWSKWQRVLVLVQPRTVLGWHRTGFRLFWRWKSRTRAGRPCLDHQRVTLIQQMWSANPTWGSKRIQAELAKLGINVSDSTVRKCRSKSHSSRRDQTWKNFLQNNAKELVSVDFFTVPTGTFRLLYVFLVLAHERRKVLHFNVTDSPSATGTAQQLTEAFPYYTPPRYLLRDRDSICGLRFEARATALGLEQKRIAPRSPWQNPFVERLVSSIRRECLDHILVLHARHLHRVLSEYFEYYHRHRPHQALEQDCPQPRLVEPQERGKIIALPQLGGLHHRYTRKAA